MKIGIITKHLDLPVGMGTYATNLLNALAAIDTENEYIVYSTHEAKRQDWPDNFSFRNFEIPKIRSRETRWDHFTAPKAAKRDGVDLIHSLHPAVTIPPVRLPVLITVHDAIGWALPGYKLPFAYNALARRDMFISNHIITVSESAKRDLHSLLKIPSRKISVVYQGGPPVLRRAGAKKPFFLFVGGTEKRKNLRAVLEAWSARDFATFRLKIVGSAEPSPLNDEREVLEALLTDKQRDSVDWLGRADEAELDRLYKQATALVFPSLYEGFGLPILEAMARRTPVITSNVSSMPEVAGGAALLVDPTDSNALAGAIDSLYRDTELQKELTRRGAEVATSFTWEKTAEATIASYEQVAV